MTTTLEGMTVTELDGVRTVIAPRANPADPITAGLLFRVGVADESVATSGITHLVEHLALHEHGLGELHYNGATADLYTHFHVQGSESEVVEYFRGLCAELTAPSLELLDTERSILKAERDGRSSRAHDLLVYRYGLETYGVRVANEAGLDLITPERVRDWVHTRFTGANAVFWLLADAIPEELRLVLPEGPAHPPPAASNALPSTPASVHNQSNFIQTQSIIERQTAGPILARIIDRRLWHHLRQSTGISYNAGASYDPRDDRFAVLTAYADASPEMLPRLAGTFMDTLAALRFGGITLEEFEAARAFASKQLTNARAPHNLAPGYAMGMLLGARWTSMEDLAAEQDELTLADMTTLMEKVYADTLVTAPMSVEWAGFPLGPQFSTESVTGESMASQDTARGQLILGTQGVTQQLPRGPVTIRFEDCVFFERYADGGRVMWGRDGFRLWIEPTLFPVSPEQLAWLDAAVPRGVTTDLPARSPEHIPQLAPAPAPTPALASAKPNGVSWTDSSAWQRFWIVAIAVIVTYGWLAIVARLWQDVGPAAVLIPAVLLAAGGWYYWQRVKKKT